MASLSIKSCSFISVLAVGLLILSLALAPSAQAQIAISDDGVTFPDDTNPVTALKKYEIGDIGPAGGRVFYVTADGLHGLEAARDDTSVAAEWGCVDTIILGAGAFAIGTGERNTDAILQGCDAAGIAAQLAAKYVAPPNGYFDWYLPSKDELQLMYDNIGPGAAAPNTNVGLFVLGNYWSSSEFDEHYAWFHRFDNGNDGANAKHLAQRVRAVRAF